MFSARRFFLALLMALSFSAISCEKKKTTFTPTRATGGSGGSGSTPTPVAITVGDLSDGSSVVWTGICQAVSGMGSDLSGTSYLPVITFNSDSSFEYTVTWYSDASCGHAAGGEIFNYVQTGTFTLDGLATTPTTATKITLSRNLETLEVFASSAAYGAPTWAGYFNSYCLGGTAPNFSTNSDSSRNPFGFNCESGTTPQFTFPAFPADGSSFKNIMILDSTASPKSLDISPPTNMWKPGESSYPSSVQLIFTHN